MATNHNRHAAHNHNSKDLEYDLTSQQDVQVYVQIRVTRHPFQTRTSRHSQTRLITNNPPPPPTNASRNDIAKHFGFWNLKRFHSLGITFVVERSTSASWTFLKALVLVKDLSSPENEKKRK